MSSKQLLRLKKAVEARYKERIDQARRDYEKEIAAIDTVLELSESQIQSPKTERSRNSELTAQIKEVLPRISAPFNVSHVEHELRETLGLNGSLRRKSISIALTRLSKEKFIDIVRAGEGRRPTEYALCDQQNNQEELSK